MTDIANLADRNRAFIADEFQRGLTINPGGRVTPTTLRTMAVSDPKASVRVDVDVVTGNLRAPAFLVSGLAHDVESGLMEVVVPPTPLSVD